MTKRDYSDRALAIADEIIALSFELRKIHQVQNREKRASLARRGFALAGGTEVALEANNNTPDIIVVGVEDEADSL